MESGGGGARQQNAICCQANGLILLPAQKNKIKNKTNMHLIVSGIWVFLLAFFLFCCALGNVKVLFVLDTKFQVNFI